MIDGLPWPVGLGLTGTGWLLALVVVWRATRMVLDGDLVPRREVEACRARAEKAEATNERLVEQNGRIMDAARVGTAVVRALGQRAGDEPR